MRPIAVLFLSFTAVMAADHGIPPRPAASDYPAHETAGGLTLGATVMPAQQAAKAFAYNLDKAGYIVVEVAVYPESGAEIDVQARDFLLRAGSDGATLRPVSADTIVGALVTKNAPKPPKLPGNVDVYTTTTIGYESGPYGRGVYTGAGVGVGVGQPPVPPPPPGVAGLDPDAVQRELSDKALPQARTVDPVAGYLYFPKPEKKMKGSTYTLTYAGLHSTIRLIIPAPKK